MLKKCNLREKQMIENKRWIYKSRPRLNSHIQQHFISNIYNVDRFNSSIMQFQTGSTQNKLTKYSFQNNDIFRPSDKVRLNTIYNRNTDKNKTCKNVGKFISVRENWE